MSIDDEHIAQLYPNLDSALYGLGSIGSVGQLGGFEDDLKRVFSLIPGAGNAYTSLVGLIQQKAKEGAMQAIPQIKSEVEATVKPFVYAALLLGFAGFAIGLSTYFVARKG